MVVSKGRWICPFFWLLPSLIVKNQIGASQPKVQRCGFRWDYWNHPQARAVGFQTVFSRVIVKWSLEDEWIEVKWKRAHFLLQFKYTSFLLSERGLTTNLKVSPVLSDVGFLLWGSCQCLKCHHIGWKKKQGSSFRKKHEGAESVCSGIKTSYSNVDIGIGITIKWGLRLLFLLFFGLFCFVFLTK